VGKKNEEGPRCERVRLERVSMRVRHKHLKKMKKIDYECEAPINQYQGIIAPPPNIRVLGTVGTGSLPSPARLGYQPSAGTSLLDNKRGVSAARPLGGQEIRKKREV
jgi:hypothetical protein